ncbi:MAG: NAD-dependent epimerase/dehydratase family protein [Vicinamibacterales bacterium]
MSTILVTGGAGFIGSHVAAALVARGHAVIVLDDLSGGFEDNVPAGATLVRGSITDAALVDRLFAEHGFAHVFHLAAYAAEGLSHFIRRFNYTNNLIGSVNLINAAVNHDVRTFVFTSSIAVYGTGPALPLTEETPARPEDPYGIAKLAVELELRAAQEMFGLDYVIFRPHNVYGEGQNVGDRYRNVVGIFMNQVLQGLPMTIFGDGSQVRAFSYIDDVAPVMARAIEVPAARNQVFNIGADRPCTVADLADQVAIAMGVPGRVEHLAARREVQVAYASHDRVRRVFGEPPGVDLPEGLARMARWVRDRGPRFSQPMDAIEIRRNLPPAWAEPQPR